MKRVILVFTLILLTWSSEPDRQITLPNDTIQDMSYTSDHKFLIVITKQANKIYLYNGFTGQSLHNLLLDFEPQTLKISS